MDAKLSDTATRMRAVCDLREAQNKAQTVAILRNLVSFSTSMADVGKPTADDLQALNRLVFKLSIRHAEAERNEGARFAVLNLLTLSDVTS